jgi:hypothetical protein
MSKKNNKAARLKRHESNLKREQERMTKIQDKIDEVAQREREESDQDDRIEDEEEGMAVEGREDAKMDIEISKGIRKLKSKPKMKIFQRRLIVQEKRRARKAKKSGTVVYRKAMNIETN